MRTAATSIGLDVDFDPKIDPVAFFNASYLDDLGQPKNLETTYLDASGAAYHHPRFHWERPTGRLHELYFFASCLNQIGLFREQKVSRMPAPTPIVERDALDADLASQMKFIGEVYYDWFNLKKKDRDHRAWTCRAPGRLNWAATQLFRRSPAVPMLW